MNNNMNERMDYIEIMAEIESLRTTGKVLARQQQCLMALVSGIIDIVTERNDGKISADDALKKILERIVDAMEVAQNVGAS